jgi:hypothetical protein
MRFFAIYSLVLSGLFTAPGYILAQTGPDDYWLNNGFLNGETVITNTGTFYDDGGSDPYNLGQDYSVRFCSENGNPITLDFREFATYYDGLVPPPEGGY